MRSAEATVVQTLQLSEHFHRVVLHVPDLGNLDLPMAADTAIGLSFGRTYTVRECDHAQCLITVDVLIHGDGIGTIWARRTTPGDTVTLAYPNSWYRSSPTPGPQLLVADLAGFPALARIIESLPSGTTAVAVVEVLDESDLDYLPQRPDVELVTSVGTGNGVTESALSDLVMARRPAEGHGYCWLGGEAGVARGVRKYLRRELHWAVDQFDIMGYWRLNSGEWGRRYANVGPQLFDTYQRALTEGKDARVAAEEFDLALEQLGL